MNREEVIYRLNNTAWLGSDADRVATEEAVKMAIEALKEQKTGKWEIYEGLFDYDWECSECGCSSYEKTDWCAHCGAKMGEEDE